jgi:hypothetical protein
MNALLGEYDLLFCVALPDIEDAIKASVTLNKLTGISFTTSPAVTVETFDQLMSNSELGGTISGEHGIGHKRRDYMELVMPSAQLEVMRGIKRALDPKHILNPGKIFSTQTT